MKKKLVLSLGSNLGNRYAYIRQAITYIEECFAAPCVCSSYYTTPPWGETEQAHGPMKSSRLSGLPDIKGLTRRQQLLKMAEKEDKRSQRIEEAQPPRQTRSQTLLQKAGRAKETQKVR